MQTPMEQMAGLDPKVIADAIKAAGSMQQLDVPPDIAAKLLQAMPVNELKQAPPVIRQQATTYLTEKPEGSHTRADAEVAARVVSATPERYLTGLNQSILTLAATIAKSNMSFASRDELQVVIDKELAELLETKGKQPEEKDAEKTDDKTPAKLPDEEEKKSGVINIDL
jgi:hypothetical protein